MYPLDNAGPWKPRDMGSDDPWPGAFRHFSDPGFSGSLCVFSGDPVLDVRGLAKQETDHILYRISLDDVRAEKNVCSTKYPLLLVHGVGFRDFHYFNYWGRILREKIFEILRETGRPTPMWPAASCPVPGHRNSTGDIRIQPACITRAMPA